MKTASLENELCSVSKLAVTSPTSQLVLQLFRRFTYVTTHSPTFPLLHLRHSSFSNPSFASPTSQALHLLYVTWRAAHAVNVVHALPGLFENIYEIRKFLGGRILDKIFSGFLPFPLPKILFHHFSTLISFIVILWEAWSTGILAIHSLI